jgi:hypothetical protein
MLCKREDLLANERPSQRESIDVPTGYVRAGPRDGEGRMRRSEVDASHVQ